MIVSWFIFLILFKGIHCQRPNRPPITTPRAQAPVSVRLTTKPSQIITTVKLANHTHDPLLGAEPAKLDVYWEEFINATRTNLTTSTTTEKEEEPLPDKNLTVTLPYFSLMMVFLVVLFVLTHMKNCCCGLFEPLPLIERPVPLMKSIPDIVEETV